MIQEAYDTARSLLAEHIDALHAVAEKLLEKEVLDGSEVEAIVKAYADGALPHGAALQTPPPAAADGPARVELSREKQPGKVQEEDRGSVPGLPPKPVLA